jgi:subtilisin family serine protease
VDSGLLFALELNNNILYQRHTGLLDWQRLAGNVNAFVVDGGGRVYYITTDEQLFLFSRNGTATRIDYFVESIGISPSGQLQVVYTSIGQKWYAFGGSRGVLGDPIGATEHRSDGVALQHFQGGAIYSSFAGTYAIYGAIGQRYQGLDQATRDRLGLPITDEVNAEVGGRVSYLERGAIYWERSTGRTFLNTWNGSGDYNSNRGYGLLNAGYATAAAFSPDHAIPPADVATFGGPNDWNLNLINAPQAWAHGFTGAGVIVAVIDTGVDYNHIELDDNIWNNPDEIPGDGIDNDRNGFIDDLHGWDFVSNDNEPLPTISDERHGTHVAGIIAAEQTNTASTTADDVTGIAYGARIMCLRVLGPVWDPAARQWMFRGSSADIAAAIRYAAINGARVINLSLGQDTLPDDERGAINFAVGRGCIVVMAAGNDSAASPDSPANMATTVGIAVGAIDSGRMMANFSNRSGESRIDYIVAPGVSVFSTLPGNATGFLSGTSMAAPHVAGVAALLVSGANSHWNLTAADFEDILIGTANPVGITVLQPPPPGSPPGTPGTIVPAGTNAGEVAHARTMIASDSSLAQSLAVLHWSGALSAGDLRGAIRVQAEFQADLGVGLKLTASVGIGDFDLASADLQGGLSGHFHGSLSPTTGTGLLQDRASLGVDGSVQLDIVGADTYWLPTWADPFHKTERTWFERHLTLLLF